jgi:magnesium transporter
MGRAYPRRPTVTFTPTAPPEIDLRRLLEQEGPRAAAARLLSYHPVEMAEALEPLDAEERFAVFSHLPDGIAAQILRNADAEFRAGILERLPSRRLAELLDRRPVDEAGNLLDQLPEERAEEVLSLMPSSEARPLQALRAYPPQSVGRLMVRRVPRVPPTLTVAEALTYLRRTDADLETVNNLYAVDPSGRLAGVVALRELMTAAPERRLADLMQRRLIMVTPETDREEAANLVSRYNFLALPVVDDEQQLLGIVTVDDLIDVLIQENTEDVLRLGGVGGHEGPSDTTPYWAGRITAVVKKRLSWLLLLFVAETFTGSVLRHFGDELHRVTALAFFIPLLIGTGGNAGSQTVTTIVRGLAVGEIRLRDALRVLWRECSTGMLLGLLLGIVAFGRALLWKASLPLAVAVAVTILAVCTWANTVGAIIPILAQRLRIDPTVVSAPFITTLVDATGLVIYFLVAKAILGL